MHYEVFIPRKVVVKLGYVLSSVHCRKVVVKLRYILSSVHCRDSCFKVAVCIIKCSFQEKLF